MRQILNNRLRESILEAAKIQNILLAMQDVAWEALPIDTPLSCSDNILNLDARTVRHFSHVANGKIHVFSGGMSAITNGNAQTAQYDYALPLEHFK